MEKGLNAKVSLDSLAENIIPKFIRPIGAIGPKFCDIVQKRLHQATAVRTHMQSQIIATLAPPPPPDEATKEAILYALF